jgi:hypothetical protein
MSGLAVIDVPTGFTDVVLCVPSENGWRLACSSLAPGVRERTTESHLTSQVVASHLNLVRVMKVCHLLPAHPEHGRKTHTWVRLSTEGRNCFPKKGHGVAGRTKQAKDWRVQLSSGALALHVWGPGFPHPQHHKKQKQSLGRWTH